MSNSIIMYKVVFTIICCIFLVPELRAQESEFPKQKQEAIEQLFKKYTQMGIPGLSISVYTPATGIWSHTEGYSNLEQKTLLSSSHTHYLQSVSKTYMAVVILMLYENGQLKLEDKLTHYLDYPWLKKITGIDKITIRMLLNHTSGLAEYSTDPLLVSDIIQNPLKVLSVTKMLSYIDGKPLEFEPGSQYKYRNTNYGLLSLVADKITGDHIKYTNENIIGKLGLTNTFYLTRDNYTQDINLVDAYWDVLLEGQPVNISKLQRANVASMKGDDGLVASTEDAVGFMKALISGQLLKPKTLELMQEWVTDAAGEKRYGLGVTYYDLDVTYAIGHSGGGIGAGCVLMYLPELDAIVFISTNFNTMMASPIRKKAENLQVDILTTLFAD